MALSNAERQAKWRARVTTAAKGAPLIYDIRNDEYRLATQADIDALLRASYALGFARATLRRALDAAREMVDASAFLAYYEISEAAQNVLANDPNAVDVRTALCPA